jgi:hypothetical protein
MCIIFKEKNSKRSGKAGGIKVFLIFFAWWLKDPDPDPDPYLWLTDPDPDPGGPKTCGSGGYGSATLLFTFNKLTNIRHEAGAIKQLYVGNVSTVSTVN